MKLGLVSDTHGNAQRLERALELLRARGIEAVVHCGDLGSEQILAVLGNASVPAYAVLGNVDYGADLLEAARRYGVTLSRESVEVAIGGGHYLVATHGHHQALLDSLILGGQFPYVCHGHTHRRRDDRIGAVRVINPGALQRAAVHTVAVLDTTADTVEFIAIA